MPTHGIGRYRHLLPKVLVRPSFAHHHHQYKKFSLPFNRISYIFFIQPKKKKDKIQAKQIKEATATEFGVLNVCVSGYDMTLVEHYSQYIHNLCSHLDIKVDDRWEGEIYFIIYIYIYILLCYNNISFNIL